jgi:hypothetical protein
MLILINGLISFRTGGRGPVDGSSEDLRQGFDDFGELLTTCAAVLVVEGVALPKERNSRKVLTEQSIRAGPVQDGGQGEPTAMCMQAVKLGAWRTLCLLPLRGSRPESQQQES